LKSELAALEELQSLDLKTLELHKELGAIPETLQEIREEVNHIASLLEREKERLKEAEEWRLEREKDVATQNTMLTKSKAKLQSVRNEKEQKAAQREIDTIRKNIQDREDEALKVMEAIEQYRAAIEDHTKEFAELEAHLTESEAKGKARIEDLQATINKVESRRSEITRRIPEKILRLYERIHKRLGRAVVEAKDGFCLGCNMEILAQTYNELQRGDKLYQCANCFRILIFKPKEEAEVPEE
jgi:predicted  nucleic acid-binding Zn-ribbon protein